MLFRQEATYSGLDGRRRLHAAERTLGMRGFLGEARISRNPNALFVRPGVLDVLEEYEHRDPWRAPPANVVARLEGTGRIREAEEILAVADKMKQGLGFAGGGDCNEYPFPAGETVREIDWSTVTDRPHMMHRTIQGPDGRRTSRTAVDELLLGAGLHDPARHAALHLDRPRALDATAGHTPSMDGQGGSRRIDHLYFDLWLVQAVLDVQVVDCSGASDHNAVVATLSYRKAAEALSRAFDPLAPLDLIVAGG
ncbi:endonuclease/exonuclease/phosphatase family protein [Streptomyces tsukubensis]|uniref:endonuclease/exonuclease/phosphatase family protein n=1 Tax=Streptomyces tsukubensis TaxID=83656 RepID=UPI00344DFB08